MRAQNLAPSPASEACWVHATEFVPVHFPNLLLLSAACFAKAGSSPKAVPAARALAIRDCKTATSAAWISLSTSSVSLFAGFWPRQGRCGATPWPEQTSCPESCQSSPLSERTSLSSSARTLTLRHHRYAKATVPQNSECDTAPDGIATKIQSAKHPEISLDRAKTHVQLLRDKFERNQR